MKRKGKRVLLDMREKTFEALTWKKTKKKKNLIKGIRAIEENW